MKKTSFLILFLTLTHILSAGDYYSQGWIDMHSPDGKLYFRGITDKTQTRGMFSSKGGDQWTKNIKVFDLQSGESRKVFEKDFDSRSTIASIEFPPPEDSSPLLFRQRVGNYRNLDLQNRKDPILVIVVREQESGDETVFVADSSGRTPRRISTIPSSSDWHLDHRYMKLRIFNSQGNDLIMTEYDLFEN